MTELVYLGVVALIVLAGILFAIATAAGKETPKDE